MPIRSACVAVLAFWLETLASNPAVGQNERRDSVAKDVALVGAAGCAAAACHGSPQPGVTLTDLSRGGEYPLWLNRDPHAQSWRTISSPESTAILQRLGIVSDGKIRDVAGFNNCLACHSTGTWAAAGDRSLAREGVGCEACHGAAADWVTDHTRDGWTPDRTSRFVPNDDLLQRARQCAGCHIGDGQRDMNHDIVAAGHPALRFDLPTYHNRLPKHWRESRSSAAEFESQLWLAGAIAAAEVSLELLESRADGTLVVSQWPEFATYDCASCHHSLDLANLRSPVGEAPRPTTPRASALHLASFRALLEVLSKRESNQEPSRQLARSLNVVAEQTESSFNPPPLPTIAKVHRAQADLARWKSWAKASKLPDRFTAHDLQQVVASMSQAEDRRWTWEFATSLYLASVATRSPHETELLRSNDPIHAILKRLRQGLAFPVGQETPLFLTTRTPPQALSRREVQELFQQMAELWTTSEREP